jgi:hypothetical protein
MKPIHIVIGLTMICRLVYSQEIALPLSPDSGRYKSVSVLETGSDLFSREDPLQVTLCFDVKAFLKSKSEPKYMKATLHVKTAEHDSIVQQIAIKARGEMRRNYCYLPPIMLKFPKSGPDSSIWPSGGKLKLVKHCNKSMGSENYVLKEYLVYKLLNRITPLSYRTRLVKICYIDTKRPDRKMVSYGFLIENDEQMAVRNNAVIVRTNSVSQSQMDPADMARVAIFNYMIGNTDWSVALQHNIKVLKPLEVTAQKGKPVIYDFDYSGFVNTTYSAPFEALPIKSVLERFYLGICVDDSIVDSVMDEMFALKEPFLDIIRDFEDLPASQRKQAESYLTSFYRMYRQEEGFVSEFRCKCQRF